MLITAGKWENLYHCVIVITILPLVLPPRLPKIWPLPSFHSFFLHVYPRYGPYHPSTRSSSTFTQHTALTILPHVLPPRLPNIRPLPSFHTFFLHVYPRYGPYWDADCPEAFSSWVLHTVSSTFHASLFHLYLLLLLLFVYFFNLNQWVK